MLFLQLAEHESSQVRSVSLDALDRSICAVLGCERIRNESTLSTEFNESKGQANNISAEQVELSSNGGEQRPVFKADAFECKVILPVRTLYNFGQSAEVRSGALKILLHVLEVSE